ncbi:MAG TPA: hypothetical protein VFA75_01310 [Nevskia sp.]|jgi:hypothetical protein|nr:hypothetical protein [Nevskia sp.]
MKALIPIVFALALAPLAALADDAAAAAPTAPPTDSLAPPACNKPSVGPKIRKADDDSNFQERVDKYKSCMEAYASAQSQLAQQHQKAANDAVAAFNDFVKEVNSRNSN